MRNGRNSTRRGVLLIVILGLLAMFGLVAVAFVVLTSHARRSARNVQQIDQYDDRPERTLHQAAMQLFRGVPANQAGTNLASIMRVPHDLLADMYGGSYSSVDNNVVLGQVDKTLCRGQLFQFPAPPIAPAQPGQLPPVHTDPSHFVGCVLTMLDGDAMGQSTRIVGISSNGQLQALAFDDGVPWPTAGDNFVINGVPFSGTGFGVLTADGGLSDLALQPGAPGNMIPQGGANEDYDAVDYQNMILAAQVPIFDKTTGEITLVHTIPSFHRPSLVSAGGSGRNVILRPLGVPKGASTGQPDHPLFTGSNLIGGFDPINGPWDVDNDGDGRTDSIWVDLGMPVRSTSDGRLYKPLFAVLCVDMDGRLNVNAHGIPFQAYSDSYQEPYRYENADLQGQYQFADGSASASLPRGFGTGAAEINLLPLFSSLNRNFAFPQQYQNLLFGNSQWEGRYGELSAGNNAMPGVSGRDDPLSFNRNFEYAGDYWGFSQRTERLDSYGSPPDLYGTGRVALDRAGRPMYFDMGQLQASDNTSDDPYEIDLSLKRGRGISTPTTVDNPFSPAEGERILRPFDCDADKLPMRLAALTNDGSNRSVLHNWRHSFTTDSRDVPCPGLGLTPNGQRRARHMVDLLGASKVDRAW